MKTEAQWDKKTLEVLETIQPSLEKLFGETEFPPDRETVEKFIDTFSMYGFHASDEGKYFEISRDGIKSNGSGNFFIADRRITEGDIRNSMASNAVLPSDQIPVEEYFDRLVGSFLCGIRYAECKNTSPTRGVIISIIARDKAVSEETKKLKESAGQLAEYRGAGFNDGTMAGYMLLDEGSFYHSKIPKDAIIGFLIISAMDDKKLAIDVIKEFYHLIVEDFTSK